VNAVALTFDDGPSEWTEAILDVLAGHGALATFFLIGSAAEARADVVRRIAADGHEVGNHTWSHPRLARDCDDARVVDELSRTSELLEQITGTRPLRFRAPYHDVDERVEALAAAIGLEHTRSTVAAPDWHASARTPLIVAIVLQRLAPGAVVGLHDGVPPDEHEGATRGPTVAAVAKLVPALAERGYGCVTASDLLG
jgi:peptidoglycan/xylan/chitin deacetylase (PgdA/CDA1 family)